MLLPNIFKCLKREEAKEVIKLDDVIDISQINDEDFYINVEELKTIKMPSILLDTNDVSYSKISNNDTVIKIEK